MATACGDRRRSFPSLVGLAKRMTPADFTELVRKGGGRMPAFAGMQGEAMQRHCASTCSTARTFPRARPISSPINQAYRFTGYRRWLDPEGYPAVAMPWGTLNAIELATGKYAWRIPFGEFPELAARGLKDTGSENYGGPLVTSGGLLFIGASIHDRKFRAFDKRDRQTTVGSGAAATRPTPRPSPTRSTGGSTSRSTPAAARNAAARAAACICRSRCQAVSAQALSRARRN